MVSAPLVKLNNGQRMPAFALGTYAGKGEVLVEAIKYAIDVGYRHFDTAFLYENEDAVGEGIRAKIDEGVVRRDEIFVTSKLWNNFHERDRVEHACRLSLNKLKLDYIDLYLIHSPVGYVHRGDNDLFPVLENGESATNDVDYLDTWKGMEDLVDHGLVKSIGVSNFNSEQLERVIQNARIKPVNNQVECSPSISQKQMTKFCKDRDVVLSAYSPLGRPNFDKQTPDYFFDDRVVAIGSRFGKTQAQVILRYLYELGTVPLPKSVTKSRILENINIFDFQLTDADHAVLDSFNRNKRLVAAENMKKHKHYPFAIEF